MSGDLEGSSPPEEKQCLRRRETATGRLGSSGRPPDHTPLNSGDKTTITIHAAVHRETSSPQNSKEEVSAQTPSSSPEDDELDQLYENRKAKVSLPVMEPQPQPADVACRPPDPLYVRRVGQRFWSTKRILDWQRQALRVREDPEAVLKPVREYGEGSAGNKEPADDDVQNQKNFKNDGEHKYYQYDENHRHYENDGEQAHYENDTEHAHYQNDGEHKYYDDKNHRHYENDEEHAHVHYENDREHKCNTYDKKQSHYENDEEQSDLSTHVYADLDPDFLAAQDAIQNASAQPFYEMDILTADEKEEQPFYKMDVTAAKDKQQEQPFYEMNVVSATEEKDQQPFYQMDDSHLDQPAPPSNVYADLDPEFVATQDEVCRRDRVKAPDRVPRPRLAFRSRQACVAGVSVVIAVTAAVVVAVIFNQRVLSIRSDDMLNQATLPTTLARMSSAHPHLQVTSQTWTTEGKSWQSEWTLYIREYFGDNSDDATALEQRYAANEVVMSLLQHRFFWPWICRYWAVYMALPCTLSRALVFCVKFGTESEYMTSHGISTYSQFFSSARTALETVPNVTTITDSALPCFPAILRLSRQALSDNDVEALANLFPYLKGAGGLVIVNCGLSAKAATSIAERLHLLSKLTRLYLQQNKIGDDGVRAIAETFPRLKKLREVDFTANSITTVGGEAMAKSIIHLQELQVLYLPNNALALSLSSLAKAFVNTPRLKRVNLVDVTCKAASFRMAAQQARDAVHIIAGQVRNFRGTTLYDGSRASEGGTQELAWLQVKRELQRRVRINISRGQLTVILRIRQV
ncbi:hypothetical protein Bbelb_404060 [Branchiostoma belcheri]|nr:hypothetical protein Bbelb_404060 [Branchiostoma belcheri]